MNWLFYVALSCFFCWLDTVQAGSVIVPGALWYDTDGNEIQAHGAGILIVDDTFYWFGEDKGDNSYLFSAVTCYSSTDLVNWEFQDDALTPIAGTNISSDSVVERPKVIYNEKNSEYVMWFHSDNSDYGLAMVGVATADTPCGPYDYRGSFKPLGADSRDESIFKDDDADQTAYLLYASDNNEDFKIAQLDSDYYNVTEVVAEFVDAELEAPGMIKRDDVYWLFASHTSGWAPNPNKYFYATSISGTWSSEGDIAPEDTDTYSTQNAYDLALGSNGIYMGDRWEEAELGNSRYAWYPLSWASGYPQIVYADLWEVDYSAGTYTVLNGTSYIAEDGTLGGSAVLLDYDWNGHVGVGYLGNGGTLTIDVTGIGADQWVVLYYANGDSTWRNTTISVNGGDAVVVDQPESGGGDVILSVPVLLYLEDGTNTLLIGADQTNYAGDMYEIIVYTQT